MDGLKRRRLLCERSKLVLIPHGEKGPREKDWHKKPISLAQFDNAFVDSTWPPNIGIILGDEVDFEGDGPEAEADLLELFDGEFRLRRAGSRFVAGITYLQQMRVLRHWTRQLSNTKVLKHGWAALKPLSH